MFEYFDIHSHIYFPDFNSDRDEEIAEMKKKKIGTITVGTGFDSSQTAVRLAEENNNLFACVGQHPDDLNENSVFEKRLVDLASHKKVVAVGECGLDFFRLKADDDKIKINQKKIFQDHIDLSLSLSKPLMLHIRSTKKTFDAYEETLAILEDRAQQAGQKLCGNAHFFAGNLDILKRFLTIGFSVSFTGVITFTSDYDELIKYTPLDMIMSETDAPFVAPVPYRGRRNSPMYVTEVVKKIAEIRRQPFDLVKKTLVENAVRNFAILN